MRNLALSSVSSDGVVTGKGMMRKKSDISTKQSFVCLPIDREQHTPALAQLTARVFSDSERDYYLRVLTPGDRYDVAASRVGFIGGKMVTHYGVFGYDMRIGSAVVRCGGIGGVGTEKEFRKRGLMDITARESIKAMRAEGYDLSMLFGIMNYYDRFGYVQAWGEATLTTSTEELPKDPPAGCVTGESTLRRPDLVALYNKTYPLTTGTRVRSMQLDARLQRSNVNVWHKSTGKPAGYVVARRDGSTMVCQEYAGDAGQALRVLGQLAREGASDQIRYESLPLKSDLAKRLRRGNCQLELRYYRNGGPMVAVINLRSTLTKMEGELSQRLRDSCQAGWKGTLLVKDAQETVALELAGGRVCVGAGTRSPHAIKGGHAIAQLLLGTETPTEVIEANGMKVSGDGMKLAAALFPAQYPMLSIADRY